jgi:hypothetical protein
MSKLNRKQWQAIWAVLVLALLCLAAGWFWQTAVVVVGGAVLIWKLGVSAKPPENAVVKSVRCGGCGLIGEPHWKTCPRCGATDWKPAA